jgi:hypothetical protein
VIASPGDVIITAESQYGPVPRVIHYFPLTDVLLIFDPNLPSERNTIGFQRRGETSVRWRGLAGFGKGAILYSGVNEQSGKPHICIVSDDRLFAWFAARGYPIYYMSIEEWRTNGTIPVIPSALFDQALEELSKIGAIQ